ncbi:MAG: hypothetical protein JSW41_04910 [Candidatus Aenigmatarchaeota archaeon]|nr:MAG: hypothetical protein JSW41_04910 [Candidatus Aenigmarchaeota archaeon]
MTFKLTEVITMTFFKSNWGLVTVAIGIATLLFIGTKTGALSGYGEAESDTPTAIIADPSDTVVK